MIRSQRPSTVANLSATLIVLAVMLGACQSATVDQATVIETFTADTTVLERGDTVTLTWSARNVATHPQAPSCSLSIRFEGEEDPDPAFPVACDGSYQDVPDPPATAGYVRYQLNVLRRPYDATNPYLTAAVTVTVVDPDATLPTTIDFFYADATTIDRGSPASLHWRAVRPRVLDGFDSCRLTRRVDGEAAEVVVASDCEGDLVEVPTDSTTADFAQYRLYVLDRAETTGASYLERTVTVSFTADAVEGGVQVWSQQFGTLANDIGLSVAPDGSGNVHISGYTSGDLDGANAGLTDAIALKLDADGALTWSAQFGTAAEDAGRDVAVDGAGNVFVTGFTRGALDAPLEGTRDLFLIKFDAAGTEQWRLQRGAGGIDSGWGVAADGAGNVVVVGTTNGPLAGTVQGGDDAFAIKFDGAGNELWARQFGTTGDDGGRGVAIDGAGNVIFVGFTEGALVGPHEGDQDAFVIKLDPEGNTLWSRQIGTAAEDNFHDVVIDGSGAVVAAGHTRGTLFGPHAGDRDAIVSKLDAAGADVWSRQLGTLQSEQALGLGVDGARNVLVTGYTGGPLFEASNGGVDAFVVKYGPTGNEVWTRQLGTAAGDYGMGITADGAANVQVTGYTSGDLGGGNQGEADLFVLLLTP